MVMKKIMLIALFLAAGTAHANDQLPEAQIIDDQLVLRNIPEG